MRPSLCDQIHQRAMEISARYRFAEVELIEVLQEAEKHRVFIQRGHSSLFAYVISELGLGESVAYGLITVARKAREVPELRTELQAGRISFSNARRVVSVITPESKDEWIEKAATLSNRQLEKAIVRVRPEQAVTERASYVTPERIRLELGLSETEMLRLRRVQDILSQSRKRPVSLEETEEILISEFLERHDPVVKAKRHRILKGSATAEQPTVPVGKLVTLRVGESESRSSGVRVPIPAALMHQLNLRDQRRCSFRLKDGNRCSQTRWLEVHHKVPVSEGGGNTLENLITLCSGHHKFHHQRE